jgi:hypothetical protein
VYGEENKREANERNKTRGENEREEVEFCGPKQRKLLVLIQRPRDILVKQRRAIRDDYHGNN